MKPIDVLIVGSGIAGLSLALKLQEVHSNIHIALITKNDALESNTRYAQGGVAAVCDTNSDSIQLHVNDTLASGGSACDLHMVESIIKQAATEINWLSEMGVCFDRNEDGKLDLALEGGHQRARVVHVKDQTGLSISSQLLLLVTASPSITLLTHVFVTDLLKTTTGKVSGVWVYDEQENMLKSMYASHVVLATGGCGQLFEYTTNPTSATGDGYAMALRAGAQLKHMQYVQFHPTALYSEHRHQPLFLLTEALRGFGAYVVDENEHRFLFSHDVRGELATRDVVTQAIHQRLKTHHKPYVYLSLKHLHTDTLRLKFPTIYTKLHTLGINPIHDLIPIVPAAHYQCGGITVNQYGQTSLANLYALGEVGCTGLHGKNRLASNSLLEALVCATWLAHHLTQQLATEFSAEAPLNLTRMVKKVPLYWVEEKKRLVKTWMTEAFLNPETTGKNQYQLNQLKALCIFVGEKGWMSADFMQLRNMVDVALLILHQMNVASETLSHELAHAL